VSIPTQNNTNYFAALQTTLFKEKDDNDATIIISNVSKKQDGDSATVATAALSDDDSPTEYSYNKRQKLPIFDTQHITIEQQQYAIFDSGATTHFLVYGAHFVNRRPANKPLTIRLPNGKYILSTHTCNLDIPWLPQTITEAHMVPGLLHSSLLSTRKFCNAGCKVSFDIHECRIYQDRLVILGTRDESTGLWKVPIHPHGTENTSHQLHHLDLHQNNQPISGHHSAMNVYTLPFKQQWMKYMHQSFFSPPIPTLIKAINNNQLNGIPMMKADLVRKYLAPSPATSKGHMKQPRKGIRSTRPKTKAPSPSDVPATTLLHIPNGTPTRTTSATPHLIQPDTDNTACDVFCYAVLADKHHGTMYTDATGALHAVTLKGNQ
jgi:hypothetical protein